MNCITPESVLELSEEWARAFRSEGFKASLERRHADADAANRNAAAIEEFARAVIQTTVQTKRAGG